VIDLKIHGENMKLRTEISVTQYDTTVMRYIC